MRRPVRLHKTPIGMQPTILWITRRLVGELSIIAAFSRLAGRIRHNRGKIGSHHAFFNRLAVTLLMMASMAAAIAAPTGAAAKTSAKAIRIVVLGDSLTAGYGLRPGQAFPARLERALRGLGQNVRIINAGVSGDTTAAGLARLDWAVDEETDAVIVELGANDALRGLSTLRARANLDKILRRLKARGLELMVAGMIAPRNLGDRYTAPFNAMFEPLARRYDAVYYPFFLKHVATRPRLNLRDGMHPNPRGVDVIVKNILPKVKELIARVKMRRLARTGG